MPNGPVHQFAGAATALAVYAFDQERLDSPAINPLTAPIAGFALGKLPDWLEPALHPNHRQFFHSFVVLFAVLYGVKKVYEWQPETDLERFLRGAALIAGSVYATHLILDGTTKKCLPLLGRL
jgi:membrane-bound metal-dependent hydrolase YbcI (DUF457 family)